MDITQPNASIFVAETNELEEKPAHIKVLEEVEKTIGSIGGKKAWDNEKLSASQRRVKDVLSSLMEE
jgi:hypothetical protein